MPRALNNQEPVGTIKTMGHGTTPTGYLVCDGAAVSRTTYAALFSAIGITHGQGDGSTTFNLPDYRGRFLRGWANGSANDPDRASRTAAATGGATGDNVGSVQSNQFASHNHGGGDHDHGIYFANNLSDPRNYTNPGYAGNNAAFAAGRTAFSGMIVATQGGNETRPINANVNYVIRY